MFYYFYNRVFFIILKSALDDLHFASTVDEEIHWASEKALMIEKESPQVKLEAVRDQALVGNNFNLKNLSE